MTSPQVAAQLLKDVQRVLKLKGQPWSAVTDSEENQHALTRVTQFFGTDLELTTSIEVFSALQNPKSPLFHSLEIFSESESLQQQAANTKIDNSNTATLLYEYQAYLSEQAEDKLKGKQRKTTQQLVKEILEKQRKTPAALAAAVAVKLAKQTEGTPSVEQTESAIEEEKAEREKTLEISSSRGIKPVNDYADIVVDTIVKDQGLQLSAEEKDNAKAVVVATLVVGAAPISDQAVKDVLPEEQAEAVVRQQADAAQKTGLTPVELQRQLNKINTSEIVSAALAETSNGKSASAAEVQNSLKNIANFDDLAEKAQKTTLQTHQIIKSGQAYFPPPATSLSDAHLDRIVRTYNKTFPDAPVSAFATYQGAQAATVLRADVGGKDLSQAVQLHSRGFDPMRAIAYAKQYKNSTMGQLYQQQPQTFSQLESQFKSLQNTALGRQLSRQLTPFQMRYLQFSSRLTSFVPNQFWGAANIVTNPTGFVIQQLGQRAGSVLASKLATTAVMTSAKSALLSLGAKTGLTSLAAKAGLLTAGIGSGPVGWVITTAQLAIQIGNAALAPVLDFVGAKSLGEVAVKGAAGAVAFLAYVPLTIALAAGSLLVLAPLAFVAAVVALLIWYIPTINIAPILSTMVQLESAPVSSNTLNPADILPPGEVPNSCPGGYPTSNHNVSEGPHVGTHSKAKWIYTVNLREGGTFTFQEQAADFGFRGLPAQEVHATHDGQAYAFPEGTPGLGGFGNFVVILAECQDIQFITIYAHLDSATIPLGGPTSVTKGQIIGLTDHSGTYGDGHHLHYEIMTKGQPFDILSWIAK